MNNLCESIETLAMALHDGELAGEELRDVELHLTECTSCRDQAAAQATAIGGLRRKLAAPPAPDTLRARVRLALDAEDRAARRPLADWLLPAGAALVAVAALALFLTARPSVPGRSVESVVAEKATARRPLEVEGPETVRWVKQHYDSGLALPTFASANVQRWGARLADVHDRRALELYYRVTTPEGVTRDLSVTVFDARNLGLRGDRVEIDGRVLRVGVYRGSTVVSYRDGRDHAYVFTSTQLTPEELVELVGTSSLLMQVRDDERRRE